MIAGIVVQVGGNLHPKIALTLLATDGSLHSYRATVDTGFTGELTMPFHVIARLGLALGGSNSVVFADGRSERLDYYYANVVWHGRIARVAVYPSEGDPLVGMDMLRGSRLTVDSWEGGAVAIEEPQPA